MKKIGIITMYYNSINYGGMLQAYALTRFLNKNGYDAEQICWNYSANDSGIKRTSVIRKKSLSSIYSKIRNKITNIIKSYITKKEKNNFSLRKEAFKKFEMNISHSKSIYNRSNISECQDYDLYITGSDQVWNLNWYNSEYFLTFVKNGAPKLSYSASMPDVSLSFEEKELLKKNLSDFSAISVREKKTAEMLSDLLNRNVKLVLDPTLILDYDDWNSLASDRLIDEKYVFCYFLGENNKARKLAKAFSKNKKMKLVTLPHLCGSCLNDIGFGDIKLYDLSPNGFVSLIKNAEYVLTDSFHVAVFSNIFSKSFFVFNRGGHLNMSERIVTLLDIFDKEERFCFGKSRETLNYILGICDKNEIPKAEKYEKLKSESIEFLLKNISENLKGENI